MANPAVLDDDDDDEEESPSGGGGALSQLLQPQTSTPKAKADAASLISKWESGEPQEGEKSILAGITANAETVKQALRDAQTRLSNIQPSARENQLAMAQAWLSPTRTGRFGDTLANVAGEQKEQLAAERARQTQIAQSGSGLAGQIYGIDQKTLDAQLALQKLQEQQWGSIVPQALRIEAAPDKTGAGKLEYKTLEVGPGLKQNFWIDPTNGTKKADGAPFKSADEGPPPSQHVIDAIGTYQAPGLSGYALTKPGSQQLMDQVFEKYPAYQEGIYPQINQTRKEFTS